MKTKRFSCLITIAIFVALPATRPAMARQVSDTMRLPLANTVDERSEPAPAARYRLRAGDVVELNFPFTPTFNQTLTIQPDGYLTLHALGPLRVGGLTLPELTAILRANYTSILRDPVITVGLKEFEQPYFIVAGEVERPGKYDLRGVTTVIQAMAVAGGLRDRAKHSEAVVFRRLSTGGFETTRLDLKKMLNEAQLGADLRLESGDMLFIPRGGRLFIGDTSLRDVIPSLWILTLFF